MFENIVYKIKKSLLVFIQSLSTTRFNGNLLFSKTLVGMCIKFLLFCYKVFNIIHVTAQHYNLMFFVVCYSSLETMALTCLLLKLNLSKKYI